ncbi:mechanosensitive ion channel family protein [Budviciaceae bacterium BWR-B9]|uniref:Mechanosensitive ion channel family protein n=1 Tax=Limnobaculum allomyrinae TaxID=2791986 RepID=A0ABS1IKK7_9GAMM|nr:MULTISPECIES: DUF3772 domain-containing protein [Limnobaculum]MBK5142263.1 mechanosensitive ion channel family protein [Limnobaculum allomyrinae]MBV7690852.1 DUF3772 domain-containing protein [Limnobaculum sp. M2-1]
MYRFSKVLLLICSLAVIGTTVPSVYAAPKSLPAANSNTKSVVNKPQDQTQGNKPQDQDSEQEEKKDVSTAELESLQQRLSDIKQQVSAVTKDKEFSLLNTQALEVSHKADEYISILTPVLTQIQAQLDVIGPAPAPGALDETPEVTKQRTALNADKAATEKKLEHSQTLKTNASNLSKQIIELRRNALKTQLALNSGSILGPRFWAPIFSPQVDDRTKIASFSQQLSDNIAQAWQPDRLFGSIALMVLAIAVWVYARKYLEKALVWLSIWGFPDGRLRRTFLAFATVIVTVITLYGGANLLYLVFARNNTLPPLVDNFANGLLGLTIFSGLIAGLGRALLSIQRPSWRLVPMPDMIASALKPYPSGIAILLMFFGTLEQLNNVIGSSVSAAIFSNGIASLLIALLVWRATRRTNRIRREMVALGEPLEPRTSMASLIHLVVSAVSVAIVLALLIGYIPLARFLTYELVWVGIVFSCLYLTTKLMGDLCESLFSVNHASGKWIKQALSLDNRYLEQATILFSAVGNTILVMFAAIALFNGTYGATTPMTIVDKAVDILGSDSFGKINIVPANVMSALISAVVGLYILRTARRWLGTKFLPKTAMDTGMRMSLVTLFSNIGYVLLILITLSLLGIEWNKLAWIVSALSVGIGFGLQEIVKNFISGLILLTERPVKVGDLVSISGVEGDIRRINVRATEIQLSDKSTVIVPNSQLISQNVRNVTMGNAQGVATIPLIFPLDIDPEQVRGILLEAYVAHEAIQDTPAPSVSFSQLTPDGITLSVTGYVSSPRVVSRTKSDLLFDILKRLRAANVKLSSPQSLVVQNLPPEIAAAYTDNSKKEDE